MNIFKKSEIKKEIRPEDLINSMRKDITATRRKKTISDTMAVSGVATIAGGATTGTIGGPLVTSLPLIGVGLGVSITSTTLGHDYALQAEGLEHRLDMFKYAEKLRQKYSLDYTSEELLGRNVKMPTK